MNSTNETFNPQLSLFIPRVDTRSLPVCKEDESDQDYETSVKTFIAEQFHNYNIGSVDRVDMITKMTPEGYPFYIAFIHFAEWYNNFQAKGLQKAVFNPSQKAKMYVGTRNYWILCENKKPLTESEVEMKAIIYKQEKELEALKKEMEAMQTYKHESQSPEAKKYASYMQEQCESAACQLFETPVRMEGPCPLKRSVADVLPDFEDAPWLHSPPTLTQCIKELMHEKLTIRPISWSDLVEEEEEELPSPPRLTRCNTETVAGVEDMSVEELPSPPPRLTRCNTETVRGVTDDEEEEELPSPPPRLTRCNTEY